MRQPWSGNGGAQCGQRSAGGVRHGTARAARSAPSSRARSGRSTASASPRSARAGPAAAARPPGPARRSARRATVKLAVPSRDRVAGMQAQPVQHHALGHAARSCPSGSSPSAAVDGAVRRLASRPRRPGARPHRPPSARPAAARPRAPPASSASAPRRTAGAPRAQPVAQRVRQRLRAAVDLQIAAEDAPPVRGQAAVDRGAQGADGGNHARRPAPGTAARSTARARRPAVPAAPGGRRGSGQRARHARRRSRPTRPSARWIAPRAARRQMRVVGDQQQRGAGLARAARTAGPSPRRRSPGPGCRSARRPAAAAARGAKARASATRCCSPPESWPGRCVSRCAKPDRVQRRRGARAAASRTPGKFQRHRDVLQRRHGRDQVERLEHDADRRRAAAGPARPRPSPVIACPASRMLPDAGALQPGQHHQQAGLAGAGRARRCPPPRRPRCRGRCRAGC